MKTLSPAEVTRGFASLREVLSGRRPDPGEIAEVLEVRFAIPEVGWQIEIGGQGRIKQSFKRSTGSTWIAHSHPEAERP